MDYYATKSTGRPRHIYRELRTALESVAPQSAAAMQALRDTVQTIQTNASKHDWRKMKLMFPSWIRCLFTPAQFAEADAPLAAMRARRNHRLRLVYPHCADEFSLEPEFIDSVFNLEPVPLFNRRTQVFTIGSCFARNIAEHLKSRGFKADTYPLSEDLNSPMSNAGLLTMVGTAPESRRNHIQDWLAAFGRDRDQWEAESAKLDGLRASLADARVVIVTLGTALDFFLPRVPGAVTTVAPKYLLVNPDHPDHAEGIAQTLKSGGATFRLATYAEMRDAIVKVRTNLAQLTAAQVVFTVSPVPVEMALGAQTPWQSVMEVDCISKSVIRAALAEVLASGELPNTHYFPSYEIVRWVGAMQPYPLFGKEDAAARHVSAEVLACVFETFIRKHGLGESPG